MLTRRELLRRGSLAGLAAAGAAAGLPACGSDAAPSSSQFPLASSIDFAAFARNLNGQVILPGEPRYDAARVLFNTAYDYIRPLAIVRAASVEDVQATVNLARDNLVQIAIRGGGHSFAGYSTGPGIVLDLAPMNSVAVDTAAHTATVAAGSKLIDVVAALAPTKLAIPSGWCPTVGAAGLTLGGGVGKLSRLYGLTCDNLRSLKLVTAAGNVITADARQNSDVFWACRGGGGGNFGVVTSLDYQLRPVDFPCNRFEWTWPWSARHAAFAAFQDWMTASPRAATGTFTFSTAAPGSATPLLQADAVLFGSAAAAAKSAAEFEASVGTAPSTRSADTVDYMRVQKDTFCADISIEQCRWQSQSPVGELDRYGTSVKSTFLSKPWPAAAVDVISAQLERRQQDATMTRDPWDSNKGKIWIETMGGAVGDIKPAATAFPYRDAQFAVQYQSRWTADAPEGVRVANIEWLRQAYAAMAPFNTGGAYVNYCDPDLRDWQGAYYAANYRRLEAVKSRIDPHDLFSFQQSVAAV